MELAWDGSVTDKAIQSSSWQTQCISIIILKNLRNPTSSKVKQGLAKLSQVRAILAKITEALFFQYLF